MPLKRNSSITPRGVLRVKIKTDTHKMQAIHRVWQYVLVTYLIDGFAILSEPQVQNFNRFFLHAEPVMLVLLGIGIFVWQLPSFEDALGLRIKALRAKHSKLLSFFLVLMVIAPLLEMIIRAGGAASAPFIGIAATIGIGIFIAFKKGTSLLQSKALPPRNLILAAPASLERAVRIYFVGIAAARSSGILATLLFASHILSIEQFAIFELASILLILALTPTIQRFYSACPQCRSARVRSLRDLNVCPTCARRAFYEYKAQPLLHFPRTSWPRIS